MSDPREPLRRIVIAGDGQIGSLAALAVKKSLPSAQVIVIGTPPEPLAIADQSPTALTNTNRLHDRLGIAEPELLVRAGGSHRLVTRMIGWGAPTHEGQPHHGAVPYGMTGDPSLKTRFAKEWGGGSHGGTEDGDSSQFAGSLAEVLASQGRFGVLGKGEPSPLDEIDYALRWNPAAYCALVAQKAGAAGVQHVAGQITGAEPDGQGGIASVTVTDAEPIAADFFIDCSGPSASLLSQAGGVKRDDWSGFLPIRKLVHAQPARPVLTLEDRFSLPQLGWLSELAGRDALQSILGLPDGVTEPEMAQMLGHDPAAILGFTPFAVTTPWAGNVCALGDAAALFEPLGFYNLDLAHRQLGLLLELLPGRHIDPLERAEFNRRANLMADGVRDILGLHYAAPAAQSRFGTLRRSSDLERLIDQFTRRGRLPMAEDAPNLSQEVSALMHALGIEAGLTPLAQAEGSQTHAADRTRAEFNAKAQAALNAAPPYGEWLGSFLKAAATA